MVDPAPILSRCHWIFDLDGTLTRPMHDFGAIRRELGVPAERGILEYIDAQPADRKAVLNRRLTDIERTVAAKAEPNPGAVRLLRSLAAAGTRLGIFTRNRRECVSITLERLGVADLFPEAVVVACEDGAPKPDPQGIRRLLNHWQASVGDALIVGDFRYDLEAGRAAGIATVLLESTPERSWSELTDLQVGSLDKLYQHWLATRADPLG